METKALYQTEVISQSGETLSNNLIEASNVLEAHELSVRVIKTVCKGQFEIFNSLTIKTTLIKKGC